MTVVELLESFLPDNDAPLLVSLSNFLRQHGYVTKVEFDFWDMKAYKDHDKPVLLVTTVKNHINSSIFQQIAEADSPYKVILVEGDRISLPKLENEARFLAMVGAGVYIRNAGWAVLPGTIKLSGLESFRLRVLDRYSEDASGVWGKHCTKCGEWRPKTEFYANPNRNARDPYRNQCKPCFNGR